VKGSILLREKLENIKTAYIFEKKESRLILLGPVVQSWISVNPGLKFNLLF
jgi:hypothetical protein